MLIVIAGIGYTVFKTNHPKPHAASTTEPTPSSSQLYSAIEAKVNATYSNVAFESGNAWPAELGHGVGLDVPGYDFKLSSQSVPSLYVTLRETRGPTPPATTAEGIIDVNTTATAVLTQKGFRQINAETYQNADTTCNYLTLDDALTLSCYTPKDLLAPAHQSQPFVTAYLAAHPTASAADITFGPLTIKSKQKSGVIGPSQTSGYDIAEAQIINGSHKKLALYYNKAGGAWQYTTEANDEFGFSCADYGKTADTQKAFYNQICLPSSNQGQIHFGTNTSALQ